MSGISEKLEESYVGRSIDLNGMVDNTLSVCFPTLSDVGRSAVKAQLAESSLFWAALAAKEAVEGCESPIEEAMASALLIAGRKRFSSVSFPVNQDQTTQFAGMYPNEPSLLVFKQQPVMQYRVDFFVVVANDKSVERSVIVECDGHEWHSTKKQIKRDRQRDRVLQSEGHKVFRFTGSEIYQDAMKCAHEVISSLMASSDKDPFWVKYKALTVTNKPEYAPEFAEWERK